MESLNKHNFVRINCVSSGLRHDARHVREAVRVVDVAALGGEEMNDADLRSVTNARRRGSHFACIRHLPRLRCDETRLHFDDTLLQDHQMVSSSDVT